MKEILDDDFLDEMTDSSRKSRGFYISLLLLVVGSITATVLSLVEIESIIGSGPIVSVLGIIHIITSRKSKERVNMFIGALPVILTIMWMILINAFRLSPNDCKVIVPVTLALAAFMVTVVGLVVFLARLFAPKDS